MRDGELRRVVDAEDASVDSVLGPGSAVELQRRERAAEERAALDAIGVDAKASQLRRWRQARVGLMRATNTRTWKDAVRVVEALQDIDPSAWWVGYRVIAFVVGDLTQFERVDSLPVEIERPPVETPAEIEQPDDMPAPIARRIAPTFSVTEPGRRDIHGRPWPTDF